MDQHRLLIDLVHIVVALDAGRGLGWMVEGPQYRVVVVQGVPIGCGRWKTLGEDLRWWWLVVRVYIPMNMYRWCSGLLRFRMGITRVGIRDGRYKPLGRPPYR